MFYDLLSILSTKLLVEFYYKSYIQNCNPSFLTEVYFKVNFDEDQIFATNSIIIFGQILGNVGGGYNAITGKFVAPVGGTYRFTVTVMNDAAGEKAYVELMKNGAHLCVALAHGGNAKQTGVCSRVIHVAAGEEVWAVNPSWASNNGYHRTYTALEGFLLYREL